MAGGASEKVYNYLYEEILSGRLPLGSPISEVEVSEALQISRSPVREAIKRMEAQGLVTHFASRGAFVTDITQRDLEEIFDLRILLEEHALETSCRFLGDAQLDALEQTLLALTPDSPPEDYYEANTRLHGAIIAYSGSRRLEHFFDMLSAQISIVYRISALDEKHFEHSTQSHLEIVRAIRARDLAAARELLHAHLIAVRDKTLMEYAIKKDRRIL